MLALCIGSVLGRLRSVKAITKPEPEQLPNFLDGLLPHGLAADLDVEVLRTGACGLASHNEAVLEVKNAEDL